MPLVVHVHHRLLLRVQEARLAQSISGGAATSWEWARKEIVGEIESENRAYELRHQSTQFVVVEVQSFKQRKVADGLWDRTREIIHVKIQVLKLRKVADALWDRTRELVVAEIHPLQL